jgi:acetoin utilization deacetylase AcuC-like enzyme
VVFTLEGGYDLSGLRDSVKDVLKEMAGLSETSHEDMASRADPGALEQAVNPVVQVQSRYWQRLTA